MYRVDADTTLLDNIKTGDRYPMDRGAPGKVILAFEGGSAPEHVETRRIGYYVSHGERDPACAAVAAPVFKHGEEFCGALSVSGPREKFDARYVRRILPEIIAVAGRVSRARSVPEWTRARSDATSRCVVLIQGRWGSGLSESNMC